LEEANAFLAQNIGAAFAVSSLEKKASKQIANSPFYNIDLAARSLSKTWFFGK
jgi:hypothetical protein